MSTRVVATLVAFLLLSSAAAQPARSGAAPAASAPTGAVYFSPPPESAIPDTPVGTMIRFGRDVFVDTQRYAKDWVGNGLNCVNCHLDAGRQPNAAPLWAAYVAYPAFSSRDQRVDTFAGRLQDCFRYSLNGKPPPGDGAVIAGLTAYSWWLAQGAVVGSQMAGRGYPEIADPPQPMSADRGKRVYAARCSACHGAEGNGQKTVERWLFPALWGRNSYNAGAGMHRPRTAAQFIRAKMPLGQPDSLSVQDAWDVAAYINAQPRPPAPKVAR